MSQFDVAVLAGGHASEHEISLLSGHNLARGALDAGYGVHPVLIARDGTWNLLPHVAAGAELPSWPDDVPGALPSADLAADPLMVMAVVRTAGARCAVIGLHGREGEDGVIQGFLDICRLPYTGCGVVASAIAIDKLHFKRVLRAEGLRTPQSRELRATGDDRILAREVDAALKALGLPVVVKAPALGSSVAVHIARDPAAALGSIRNVLAQQGRCLVESYIAGRELTCAVLGPAHAPRALPVIEIVPRKADWFDYASKYDAGGADEIVPARIPDALAKQVTAYAQNVHTLLDARGVTRTDFMVDAAETAWILEVNTLPGMTDGSLVPKAARAAGLSMPELVRSLIEDAVAATPAESVRTATS